MTALPFRQCLPFGGAENSGRTDDRFVLQLPLNRNPLGTVRQHGMHACELLENGYLDPMFAPTNADRSRVMDPS